MGAREMLHELAAAGVEVAVVGDKVRVQPAIRLTDQHRLALREAKTEIISLLSAAAILADLEAFEERAAILEFDAGMPRADAEVMAAAMLAAPAGADSRPYKLTRGEGDAAHAEAWDDAAIARFQARVASIRRRGFGEQAAEDLAERAHLLDVQAEGRSLCLDCRHLIGSTARWCCGNHKAAGMPRDLAAELVTMAMRCPGVDKCVA